MKDVRVLPEVFGDLVEARGWYEDRGGQELAERFIETAYSALGRLSANADLHRAVFRDFRRVILRPFPYKLYFKVTREIVVVVLVIHSSRDPRLIDKVLNQRQQGL